MLSIKLLWEALFLSEPAYAGAREQERPFLRGLLLVVLVALVVAFAGLVGEALHWATSPDTDAVVQTIRQGIERMPWYRELAGEPEFVEQFNESWEIAAQFIPNIMGAPNVGSAALQIVLLPLCLVVTWLIYGLIAYLVGRVLGGQGGLGALLGATALAVGPQLLNLFAFFPYVAVGGVVGVWTLLSCYVAVKTSQQLSWGRALVATFVPYLLFYLLMTVSFFVGSMILGALIGGGASS